MSLFPGCRAPLQHLFRRHIEYQYHGEQELLLQLTDIQAQASAEIKRAQSE